MGAGFWKYVVLALAIVMAPPGDGAEQRTYKVAIDAEFAPFEFATVDGSVKGIVPDILRTIGKSADIQFTFIPMSWTDAVAALNSGRVDLVQMIRTDERERHYTFSKPFIYLTQAMFRNRKQPAITGLDDLSGRKVALQRGDIAVEWLQKLYDFRRIYVDNKAQGFELLNIGHVDVFFAAELPGQHFLRTHRYLDVELARGGLLPKPLCFTARKGREDFIGVLDRELMRLKESGRLGAIVQYWQQEGRNGKLPAVVSVLAGMGVFVLLVWLTELRRWCPRL